MPNWLIRTERLLGTERLKRLQEARISIVGVGAVGGAAIEALARSGLSHMTIMDYDRVEKSNINRQVIALTSTLGESKVEVMKRRLADINPEIDVTAIDLRLNEDNHDLIMRNTDLVIDCIDELSSKAGLLSDCYFKGVPVISSMGAALRRDPRFIKLGDIMESYGCPLAKNVRTRLRKAGVGRGIECVFSSERVNFAYKEKERKEDSSKNEFSRPTLGSIAPITTIFGSLVALLAMRKLLGEETFRSEDTR